MAMYLADRTCVFFQYKDWVDVAEEDNERHRHSVTHGNEPTSLRIRTATITALVAFKEAGAIAARGCPSTDPGVMVRMTVRDPESVEFGLVQVAAVAPIADATANTQPKRRRRYGETPAPDTPRTLMNKA